MEASRSVRREFTPGSGKCNINVVQLEGLVSSINIFIFANLVIE